MKKENKEYKLGILAAITSMILWGFLPIYWRALKPIDPYVIIFYRVVLVGVVCFIFALSRHKIKGIKSGFKNKKNVIILFFAGLLITINWSIYIWAVNSGYVIQTAIGYYIEPLIICCFGVIIFKEKLDKYKLAAIILALIGLIVIIIHFGEVPTIALAIAVTFAIYAAIKKHLNLDPILSLLYETMFLIPIGLAAIIYLEIKGRGAINAGEPYQLVLLLLAGVLTAIPLGLFGYATSKINLVALGIIEYIAPSISLILGIFLFKEGFDKIQLISFIIIWIGLIIFTYGERKAIKEDSI